jgi:hypothetical protein
VRTTELDQLAARRDADLVEREEQIAGERAAMRAEANRVKAEALNEATRLRMEAESEADAVRSRARIDAERMRDEARLDVDRLDDVRTRTQSEIRRMAKVLLASVGSDGTAGGRAAGGGADRVGVGTRFSEPIPERLRDTPCEELSSTPPATCGSKSVPIRRSSSRPMP